MILHDDDAGIFLYILKILPRKMTRIWVIKQLKGISIVRTGKNMYVLRNSMLLTLHWIMFRTSQSKKYTGNCNVPLADCEESSSCKSTTNLDFEVINWHNNF